MIDGLDNVLESYGQPGLTELRRLLEELLGGREAEGRVLDQQALQPRSFRVFRLQFLINGGARQVIVKRLKPEIAQCCELVERRWLPAVGMREHGPALLGSVAEPSGNCAWHVYDDLGHCELDTNQLNREHIRAGIELIARLHTRFACHPLLGEVRLHGGDLGIHFNETSRAAGWTLPSTTELNFLFETAEYARIANRIIWPAIALVQDRAPWGWDTLAEIEQWFENLKPVLPWENKARAAVT